MKKILLLLMLISTQAAAKNDSIFVHNELEASVALMAKIRTCFSPSFSPDGKRLAFVSDLNGIPQVWTVATEGGWPELVTAFDDPVGSVTWSPDGAWLAFSLAPGGGLNTQIYLVRPDGSDLRRLTDGGQEHNFLGDWTYEGRAITLSSNRRDPASTDSYLFDIASGKMQFVAENKGVGGITEVSRDGKYAVLSRLINRGDNDLFLVNLANSQEMRMTPHAGPGSFGIGAFSPDGQTIYLSSNKDRDLIAFGRVKLGKDGQPGSIEILAARDDAELADANINDQGTMAALLWNVAGRSELSL